jgi:hypothetical protein
MSTGSWVELCTSEIVACDDSGTLGCDGGWPQNAFDYVAAQGSKIWSVTSRCEDDYDELYKALYEYDKGDVCEAIWYDDGGGGAKNGATDKYDNKTETTVVEGYEYATAPCTCYVLGNRGCECGEQDEEMMALNIGESRGR